MICWKVSHKHKLIDHIECKEIGIYSSKEKAEKERKAKEAFEKQHENRGWGVKTSTTTKTTTKTTNTTTPKTTTQTTNKKTSGDEYRYNRLK